MIDEAGMIGTASMARLSRLASGHAWRLVLVGDTHQLQAVGRGGMFNELCATGRVHEMTRIHRFTEEWEAAASLRLRHGDPAGLDDYFAHDRVVAGIFDEQLALVVERWRAVHAAGGTCAITASSNDHVDALNAAIQSVRLDVGDLAASSGARIGGHERAYMGDVVVTRRNDRSLTTNTGDPVRNRETWTVTGMSAAGSITVSSNRGAGTTALPAEYTRSHVRLGYAATEYGNQGDTTAVGIELVSEATTRRGLYVGATRGRDENLILVVTSSHDLDEARDVLERVLANDRPDLPAVAQRRTLAEAARPSPASRQRPEPRCEVPEWLPALESSIDDRLQRVEEIAQRFDEERNSLVSQQRTSQGQLADAEHLLDPHRPELAAVRETVEVARERVWSSNAELARASTLKRRGARAGVARAHAELDAATASQERAEYAARPALDAVATAHSEIRSLRDQLTNLDLRRGLELGYADLRDLRRVAEALHTWRRWADGHPIAPKAIAAVVDVLDHGRSLDHKVADALASPLLEWAERQGVRINERSPATERSIDLDIGM